METARDKVGGDWLRDLIITTYDSKTPSSMDVIDAFNKPHEMTTLATKAAAKKAETNKRKRKKADEVNVSDTLDRSKYNEEEWAVILRQEEILRRRKERELQEKEATLRDWTEKREATNSNTKATVMNPIDKFLLICDESHNIQNPTTAKTKKILALAKLPCCVGVLLLTGTPSKNGKPKNLFPLLRCIRHKIADNQRDYEKKYCDGGWKPFGNGGSDIWWADGSSDLEGLYREIGPYMFSKTKEEVLSSLPKRKRLMRQVEMNSIHKSRYRQNLMELARVEHIQQEKKAAGIRKEDDHAILGKLTALRMTSR